MVSKPKGIIVPRRVMVLYEAERKQFIRSREWKKFNDATGDLMDTDGSDQTFDPRTNALHWALDVSELCRQIVISYLWMKAYARYYKDQISPGSLHAHTDFHVTYFADNCVTRMDSIRDKLGLTVWAFYCPFNPEKRNEMLDLSKIIERLENPVKFALKLAKPQEFLVCLKLLQGQEFSRIEHYRHLKIHRREPQIEIYGIAPHHDWSYMLPLTEPRDIARWEQELEESYPDQEFRERIRKKCFVRGTLYERRRLKDRVWDYSELEGDLDACLIKVLGASCKCFQVLKQRILSISRKSSVKSLRRKK